MIEVKLTKKQFDFLIHGLKEQHSELLDTIQNIDRGKNMYVLFDEDISKQVRTWAIDELGKRGLDADFNPTAEGVLLQELIYTFSPDEKERKNNAFFQ